MTQPIYNFSPGPAMLPRPVLEKMQRELLALPGTGCSILEISHRSKAFLEILASAKEVVRKLLKVPEDYHILFLQGGGRLQFSMIPLNFLAHSKIADYLVTGSWSQLAALEAKKFGVIQNAWDGEAEQFKRFPSQAEIKQSADADFLYFTSNETIHGVQCREDRDYGDVAVVCDCSSDLFSRPIDIQRYDCLYCCAQKNAGPVGATIVIIKEELLQRSKAELPGYLNFSNQVQANSLYNTAPTFSIYGIDLVAKWLETEFSTLEQIAQFNEEKANLLYQLIDQSASFYQAHAEPASRSWMNVVFTLPNQQLEAEFLKQAETEGLVALKGHRYLGGVRASIYNAMPRAGVMKLRDFMHRFHQQHA